MRRSILLVGFLIFVKHAHDQPVFWRDYNKINIPRQAVNVGFGIHIGQSNFDGVLVPGTIYSKSGRFITENNGKQERINNVQIMCSENPLRLSWEYIDVKKLPENLSHRVIIAGDRNNIYYIGRAFHQNEWRIGKVDLFDAKSLLIWNNDGTLHKVFNFEVLTDAYKINESPASTMYNFTLSLGAELDLLPEDKKDLVKTAIWQVIYEVKNTNKSNIEINI
ncbi:uncharacterized protein [Onthophagus taurus]|uniref:uncharacterized protein n=1 Tax=Onthophagus taurus TaxID=166361 RepID=UPI0039BDAC81